MMLFSITKVCNDIKHKGLAAMSESLHHDVIFPLVVCELEDMIRGRVSGVVTENFFFHCGGRSTRLSTANHPWLGLCGPDTLNCYTIIIMSAESTFVHSICIMQSCINILHLLVIHN
jgi:hypothetical protein